MGSATHAALTDQPGPVMSDAEFSRLSELIRSECGINITPVKKVMLTARLSRRIRSLGIPTFSQYVSYLESKTGKAEELPQMIDAVSTNKTGFFREAGHFDYLSHVAAPSLSALPGLGVRQAVNVWSAGCSTGEEAYTIAMALAEYSEKRPGFRFRVHATDISTRALKAAVSAVYPAQSADNIPPAIRKKYMLRGKGRMEGFYRVSPEIRTRVFFRRHNLAGREFRFDEPVHAVFCRNVIIYLDRKVQIALFDNFHRVMADGGYLFVGHSETLDGVTDRFVRAAPTIYRRI